jgi:hypothetical protein
MPDTGDIGGEDGGKGLDVRNRSGGSSDLNIDVRAMGEWGRSDIEEAVEGLRHSTADIGRREFDFPLIIFKGVKLGLIEAVLSKIGCRMGREADIAVDPNERECVFMGIGLLFQRPLSEDTAKHVWRTSSNSSSSSSPSIPSGDGHLFPCFKPSENTDASISDANDGSSSL